MKLVGFIMGMIIATALFMSAETDIQTAEKSVPIMAVNMDSEGTAGLVTVRTIPGSGNVLVETRPYIQPDLQQSANVAIAAARIYTRIPARDVDFIISYDIDSDIVGGGSAGAATAVAAVAALTGKDVREDAALTGTISPSGRIGQVGSVLEKARAAGKNGYDLLIVPQGQASVLETRPAYGRRQSIVDVQKYNISEEAGIDVVSAVTLDDAVRLMLN